MSQNVAKMAALESLILLELGFRERNKVKREKECRSGKQWLKIAIPKKGGGRERENERDTQTKNQTLNYGEQTVTGREVGGGIGETGEEG